MLKRLIFAVAALFLASAPAGADYAATQGSGTTFGSTVAAGIHYPQFNLCDPTTPARCIVVNASGQIALSNTTFAATQGTSPWIVAGEGTAGSPATGVVTVQGVGGGTALPVSGPGIAGLPSGGILTIQGSGAMTPVAVSQATAASLNATVVGTGTFVTQSTLAAETTKVIGTVNIAAAQTIATTNAGTFATQAQPAPVTSGGLSWYFVQPAASDNHVVIKAGAGQVYNIQVTNNSATVNYLRLYNATTGFNGCNSATNLVGQWAIPASTSVGGLSMSIDMGIAFATGISICVTSGYATTDTTNATASAMSVNVGYK